MANVEGTSTNLVELRERYERAKRMNDIARELYGDLTQVEVDREREAAQAMISGVGDWYEERERRAIRELTLALPARGEVV